jgi:xanthine dehydrogenase accessory factor
MDTSMIKQLQTWKFIAQNLNQNIPVMLLYVLESNGSSPGRQGFSMAVNASGDMQGSIGGGIMEYKFVERAKKKLIGDDATTFQRDVNNSQKSNLAEYHAQASARPLKIDSRLTGNDINSQASHQKSLIRKQVHDASSAKNKSGMICSGEQTILSYKVKPQDSNIIQKIISLLETHQPLQPVNLKLSPAGIEINEELLIKNHEFVMYSEDDWIYKEKLGYKNLLTIIGGGHCSLAFSSLMRQLDFYIKIYDERSDLKTMLENDTAHEKHLVKDYTELTHLINSGSNHYVVIMTFGYRSDDIALRALMNKEFRYIGLLGSKKKIEKMFADYQQQGIDKTLLQNINTPIGLAIKSQTPEEIAISIAAEIICEKNREDKHVDAR